MLTNGKENIIDQAWGIIEFCKYCDDTKENQQKLENYLQEWATNVTKIDDLAEDISIKDAYDFLENFLTEEKILHYIEKTSFENKVQNFLFEDLKTYEYYFRIGVFNNFPEVYELGDIELIFFPKLPTVIRDYFTRTFKEKFEKEGFGTLIDHTKDWYMKIDVKSKGIFRSKEKAFEIAEKYKQILHFLTEEGLSTILRRLESPYDFCSYSKENLDGELKHTLYYQSFGTTKHDNILWTELSSILRKKQLSEIESKILNALELQRLIESDTPIRIKFLLTIISLEGLLLDKGDTDHLKMHLAEKTVFLVSDLKEWNIEYYQKEHEINYMDEKWIKQNLLQTRVGLEKIISELYDKRSKFAHKGLKNKGIIKKDDYHTCLILLKLVIQKLLSLLNMGITHVPQREKNDKNSLDFYIKTLKYNS